MRNVMFVISMLLAVPALAGNSADWDQIRNDSRYVISGPVVNFPSDQGVTEVRYVDTCLAGDKVVATTVQCATKKVRQVPGRGTHIEEMCPERVEVKVARSIVTTRVGCVERQWTKVRETSNGPQGLYDWVCTAEGELRDEVPLKSPVTVSFFKAGRFSSIGAPLEPDSILEAEYSIPSCR